MNEEITNMSLLICHLDVSIHTKNKLYTQNYKINEEIERLNNIIDELEKWLNEKMNEYKEMEHDDAFAFEYVLDKLKELKEGK